MAELGSVYSANRKNRDRGKKKREDRRNWMKRRGHRPVGEGGMEIGWKEGGVMQSELGDEGSRKQVRVRGTEHRWRKGEEDGGWWNYPGHWMRGCEKEEDKRKLGLMDRQRGWKKEGWKNKPESEAEKETLNVCRDERGRDSRIFIGV